MELHIWIITIIALIVFVLVMWGVEQLIHAAATAGQKEKGNKVRRRSVAGAAFAFQQFFEPGIEHVVRAEQDEPGEEDESSGEGNRDELIDTHLADILESLGRTPVDPEEVRRILASAQREGLDWRSLYDTAVESELKHRSFRAPFLPSVARVAPRTEG